MQKVGERVRQIFTGEKEKREIMIDKREEIWRRKSNTYRTENREKLKERKGKEIITHTLSHVGGHLYCVVCGGGFLFPLNTAFILNIGLHRL